jgi:septal ring factor EnvC (AmiA/AmiB activator)
VTKATFKDIKTNYPDEEQKVAIREALRKVLDVEPPQKQKRKLVSFVTLQEKNRKLDKQEDELAKKDKTITAQAKELAELRKKVEELEKGKKKWLDDC